MEEKMLRALVRFVLPSDVAENFVITEMEQSETELHIHLDERMNDALRSDVNFESKGFIPAVEVTDFPIRDHKVVLHLRRRRWVDLRTGKSFLMPIKIAADGTRYSKEFAAFLKETYGHGPGDLPYA